MTGVKGRSGSGGNRLGAGRPRQLRPDKLTRRKLRMLMFDRRNLLHDNTITEEDTLAWLIDEKYQEWFRQEDALAMRHKDAVLSSEQEYLEKGKKMNTATLLQHLFGSYLDRTKSYPEPLPSELQPWYCYTTDGGHSIVASPSSRYTSEKDPEQFLVPIPVKTVLRGYQQRDGYILVDVPYDSNLGLQVPSGDDEF